MLSKPVLVAAFAALLLVAACQPAGEADQEGAAPPEAETAEDASAGDPDDASGDGAYTATDYPGTTITLDEPAERVVCLDGSCLDGLYAVGLEPDTALIYEMATHENFWGPDANIAQLAGAFFEPDVEEIVAAGADLVIGTSGVHADLVAAVEDVSPIYLHSLNDLDDARDFVRDVGALTGRSDEAEATIAAFDAKVDAYRNAISGDRIPLSMYGSDLDFGIDAADSIIGNTLAEMTDYPWPEAGEGGGGFLDFSVERILEVDPDTIFIQTMAFDPDTPPLSEQLAENELWSELSAVQSGDVYEVETSYWAAGRALRTQELILDETLPHLYPDEVPEPIDG